MRCPDCSFRYNPNWQHMYHITPINNKDTILRMGLKVNQDLHLTEGGQWAIDYYGLNPIYLSKKPWITDAKTIAWGDEDKEPLSHILLKIDVTGLALVADLPSLIDKGANFDTGYFWWKHDHKIPKSLRDYYDPEWGIDIEFLLEPGSGPAEATIEATQTAACLETIPPERIFLIGIAFS